MSSVPQITYTTLFKNRTLSAIILKLELTSLMITVIEFGFYTAQYNEFLCLQSENSIHNTIIYSVLLFGFEVELSTDLKVRF